MRTIGQVAIDAILRDAGQHVPHTQCAAELMRRTEAMAQLPPLEPLSKNGKEYTTESYSLCDACELAALGDALFFQLGDVALAEGGGFLAATDSSGLISYESWLLLSQGGSQPIRSVAGEEEFTHLGLPLFATNGHFLRQQLLLPEVLKGLCISGTYTPGVSERQMLSLLGRAVAVPPRTEAQQLALLHKARGVHAVLAATVSPDAGSKTLLDDVLEEAAQFHTEPNEREKCKDLYSMIGAAMLMQDCTSSWLESFAESVSQEALRRRVARSLRNTGEASRLFLAWALLGPCDGETAWLDESLPCAHVNDLTLSDTAFNPFDAPNDLKALDQALPGKLGLPRACGSSALLSILSSRRVDALPAPIVWSALKQQLGAWGQCCNDAGGVRSVFATLDSAMTRQDTCESDVEALKRCSAALRGVSRAPTLREAFSDPQAIVHAALRACVGDVSVGEVRLVVARSLQAIVERRAALVRQYSIRGADFPCLDVHSKANVHEIWGSQAYPVDHDLYRKAAMRVQRRMSRAHVTTTTKEALTEKEYRKRGGKFAFPSPMDTFIRGLHHRTRELRDDWINRLKKETAGCSARQEAVAEMLLRLRWDDSNDMAREKLSRIIGRIWSGLEGLDVSELPPISSALWLADPESNARDIEIAHNIQAVPSTIEQGTSASASTEAPSPPPPPLAQSLGEKPKSSHYEGSGRSGPWPAVRELDAGLQSAFNGLPAELRRRLDSFAAGLGSERVKLPTTLRAKQRKAVHVWATIHGLESKSFGNRQGRRLNLWRKASEVRGEEAEDWNDEDFSDEEGW
eukprot:TRINITY_DN19400_c0_g1_i2.p1 TRINITY_DN19400_c0_g1~~TRINITY_DN19400_c0_g1_i2.p1  ORF type:complete len:802 (+),score=110.22 TRINITY_DN19400_c0_g1_i2:216-2621(+)